MRPLKIELQYFGPYEHETIDFGQFRDQSLFLVAGNTGAGKTTIFDAMCYALFGQTTNDRDRSAAALRSDFALADQETKVTFTFVHQGVTYQIRRRPKQILQGRRGKLVEHNQAVQLIYPLDSDKPNELTKIKEVDTMIVDLLKMTRDQFRQIVLLPQGKFRQFLDSDSNTKERLLRDLFNTGQYERWTQALRNKLGEQKKGLADQQTKLQSLKETVTELEPVANTAEWLQDVAELQRQLEQTRGQLRKEEQAQQQAVRQLTSRLHQEQELQKNLAALEQLKEDAGQLSSQADEMNTVKDTVADLEWFQERAADYRQWVDGESRQTKLEQEAEQAAARLDSLMAQEEVLQGRQKELAIRNDAMADLQKRQLNLEQQLPLFAETAKLRQQAADLEAICSRQVAGQEKRTKDLAAAEQELAKITSLIEENADLPARQIKLAKQQGEQEKLAQAGDQLTNIQAELNQGTAELKQLKATVVTSKQECRQASAQLADLNDAYARQQIVRLAKRLKPGTPCPVCGSLEHPEPALAGGDVQVVTDTQLTTATQAAQNRQNELVQLEERVKEAEKRVTKLTQEETTLKAKLAQQLAADGLPSDWQELVDERQRQLVETERDLTELSNTLAGWQDQQRQLQDKINSGRADLAETDSNIQQARQALIKKQTVLAEKRGQLPAGIADKDAAQKQLAEWKDRLDDFNQQQAELQEQLQKNAQAQAGTQTRLDQAQAEQAALKEIQAKRKADLVQGLDQYNSQLEWDFWNLAANQVSRLPTLRQRWQDYQERVRDNQHQQDQLRHQIAGRPSPDLAASQAKLTAAEQQASQQQQALGQLQSQIEHLQTSRAGVEQLVAATGKASDQLAQLQTLTDVVAGNTESHLGLERYVLQAYFRDVLEAANVQLARLTNGRYQFELATESHGAGAKWSGLEVNIYDDNAGKTRSARTLSGGESFMASLALALALCQIIQEQSGGISIDALFVDEGFGSLDQEALADALRALQELEGYRMIGIISHVTELEEQIPDQLLVKSINGRSTVAYQHNL